jgi:hypothetical protein
LLRAVGIQPITYASAEAFRADLQKPHFDCLMFDLQLPGGQLRPSSGAVQSSPDRSSQPWIAA